MRISRPTIESYTTTDRATKKTVTRHRVRWRSYAADGERGRPCKVSGFETKGRAQAFISDCLDKAKYGIDGWSLDTRGYPVRATAEAEPDRGPTMVDLLRSYVGTVWCDVWKPGTRTNKRGRLLMAAALLVDDPAAGAAIADALAANARRRKHPPAPTTQAEWVALYLRDHPLRGKDEPSDDELGPDLAAARTWLEDHSLPLTELDFNTLRPLRRRLLDGVGARTGRTYWTVISAVFNWALEAWLMDRSPEAGLPKLRRDPDEEVVDPKRVPDPAELDSIAGAIGERFGRHARCDEVRIRAERTGRMLVIVMAYCALRIGEVVALRRCDIRFDSKGAAWITVVRQDREQVAADSDDGATTRATTPTKGRSALRTAHREVRLRPSLAGPLQALLNDDVEPQPDARVFRTRLDRPVNPDVLRKDIWNPTIAELFPKGHRLEGITPHAARWAGMTMWLRRLVPLKIIQQWGDWRSLKVMLDVYASVLPDDLDFAAAACDADEPQPAAATHADIEGQIRLLTEQLQRLREESSDGPVAA